VKLILCVGYGLLVSFNLFLFGVDVGKLLGIAAAKRLLAHGIVYGFIRVAAVILYFRDANLALHYVEFGLVLIELVVEFGELVAPEFLVVWTGRSGRLRASGLCRSGFFVLADR
jgi:hypothetical protein